QDVARAIGLNEVRPQIFAFAKDAIFHRHAAFTVIEQLANTTARECFVVSPSTSPCPPVFIRRVSIKSSGARDRDVLLLKGVDERRIVHALGAFETRVNNRQIFLGVSAELERRTF